MTWNPKEPAHACLCFFEKWHHDHRDTGFTAAGEWSTLFLIKSAAGESTTMRESKARAHATLLDQVFISLFRAVHQGQFSQGTAIQQIAGVLVDDSKKMSDLGDPVNAAYKFKGEQ